MERGEDRCQGAPSRRDGAIVAARFYDALGQLTNVVCSDTTPSVSFAYDRLGRQVACSMAVPAMIYECAYSPATLALASETIIDLQASTTNILSRTQDPLSRPSGLTVGRGVPAEPSPYSAAYAYDAYGRFHSVSSSVTTAASALSAPVGAVCTYLYDPASGLLAGWDATQPGSGVTNRVRKAFEPSRDLVASVSNSVGAATAWSPVSYFAYANDALGRRTARRDVLAGVSSVVTNAFAYNLRSEVQSAQMRYDTYSYGYDPIGNRLFSTNGSWGLDYTANQLNQYDDLGMGESWRSPLAYDADGNCATNTYEGWIYDWDAENRLVAAWREYEDSGEDEWGSWYYYEAHRTEYQYDHQSRRVGKAVLSRYYSREAPWTTNAVFRYDFDGWNLVRELASYDCVNFTTNSYVWGLDLSGTLQGAGGVGGLVAAFPDAASASTQFLYEPLGTNRAPDVAGWNLSGYYSNLDVGGWKLQIVEFFPTWDPLGIRIGPLGYGSIRSPALDGVGTLHFKARPDLTLNEEHRLAVETATSTSGPWTQISEVTVPVSTYTDFHVPIDDARSGVYVRIRRTTTSTNIFEGNISVRNIAISRYSDLSLGLFPAYDANGNVTDLVDANGVHQAHYEYSPFGELASESGTKAGAFPFRFSTKYWDNDAYLYYYGYRWYDPWLGRWVNRDPILQGTPLPPATEAAGSGRRTLSRRREEPQYVWTQNRSGIGAWDYLGLHTMGPFVGSCGPDVTGAVDTMIRDVTAAYNAALENDPDGWVELKPWRARWDQFGYDVPMLPIMVRAHAGVATRACNNLSFFTSGFAVFSSWDIGDGLPTSMPGSDVQRTANRCAGTFSYRGHCFYGNSLNYILYGHAVNLCNGGASSGEGRWAALNAVHWNKSYYQHIGGPHLSEEFYRELHDTAQSMTSHGYAYPNGFSAGDCLGCCQPSDIPVPQKGEKGGLPWMWIPLHPKAQQ